MREDMPHDAGDAAPSDLALASGEVWKNRYALQRMAFVEIREPVRGRHFGHAAEQALRRAGAHQHITVGAAHDKSGATAQRSFAFGRAARKRFSVTACKRR